MMPNHAFPYFVGLITAHALISRMVGYLMPLYFQELGFSGVQIGLYFSAASIATIALSLPMGISTDRKRLSTIFMISLALSGASYVGFLISRSFWVFCGFAMLGSFGGRLYHTAHNTMFFKLSGANNNREVGVFTLVSQVAAGIGIIAGGFIVAGFDFRMVFLIMFVSYLVFAALSYFLPHTETVVISLAEYRQTVLTPKVLFLVLVFMLSSLHWGAETVAYGPFLRHVLGLDFHHIGVFTGLGLMMVGVGAYLGAALLRYGWLKDVQSLFVAGLLLAGIFHVLMCAPNVYWSFLFRVLHEIGDGFVLVVFYHGIARVFNLDRIGGCAAFIALAQSVSAFGSSIFFGYISDVLGYQWPLIMSGVVMVLAAALLHGNRRGLFQMDATSPCMCSPSPSAHGAR
jgi:MFS family permease